MAAYPKKAIVVGLDGVTPPWVLRMIERGRLPNFRRFLEEGTLAPFTFSSLPTSTPENWTSIATGAWNGAHQVMSFQTFQPEELGGRWMAGFSSALERAGKRTILLKYPASWPPTMKGGVQVCGCHVRPCLHQLDGSHLFATVPRPGATPLELSPAQEWKNLRGNDPPPLEGTIEFGRRTEADRDPSTTNLSVPVCKLPPGGKRYHVLLHGQGGQYRALAVCRDRDFATCLAELAPGQWSEWVLEDFETEAGPRQGSFRFRLEELSPDGAAVRLFSTQIMDVDHYSFPESVGRELYENVGPYLTDMGWDALGHRRSRDWIAPEAFVELADYQHNWFAGALRYLTSRYEWTLAMMQVHCIDCINHYCLTLADPATNPDAQEAARYRAVIEALHESLDRMLGRIMADADEETLLVLVSDHGGMADGPKPDLDAILREAGLEGLWCRRGANFVNVNLKGREPEGSVEPREFDRVRERIIAALMEHVDPQTGRHPFGLVLRKEDARVLGLWGDPGARKIGDVLFALRERFGGTHGSQLSSAAWGIGSNGSLLAFRGPGIRQGARLERTAWLVDVVPTICYLLDAPVPRHCHGAVLHQALEAHPRRDGYR